MSPLEYAYTKSGLKEVAGPGSNPFIVECLALAGLPTNMRVDSTAWCGAFVNRCMHQAGIPGPRGPAAALHWLEWGSPLAEPLVGCVVVFNRPPSPTSGHVSFYLSETPTHIRVFGGNQSNRVCARLYPKSRLLGYRGYAGLAAT